MRLCLLGFEVLCRNGTSSTGNSKTPLVHLRHSHVRHPRVYVDCTCSCTKIWQKLARHWPVALCFAWCLEHGGCHCLREHCRTRVDSNAKLVGFPLTPVLTRSPTHSTRYSPCRSLQSSDETLSSISNAFVSLVSQSFDMWLRLAAFEALAFSLLAFFLRLCCRPSSHLQLSFADTLLSLAQSDAQASSSLGQTRHQVTW